MHSLRRACHVGKAYWIRDSMAWNLKERRKGAMKKEEKRKKGFILITFFIVLAVALVFGIGSKSALSEPARKAPKEIRIGDIVSYTGPYATFGINSFGVKAAIEDINKQGGIYMKEYGRKLPVRWITLDVASDPLKVAPLTEDLILREKVHFLGPHLEVPTMRQGTAVMAEKYKIPAVFGVGPFESWMAMKESAKAQWKYSWALGFAIVVPPEPGDWRYGNPGYLMLPTWFGALGAYAGKTNKKVAAFALDDADGRAWYMIFTGSATKEGYDCYGAEKQFGIYPGGTNDFSPVIKEWMKYGCEILWGNCPGPDYGILWKQCHVLGFKPKLVFATRAGGYYHDVESWGGDLPHAIGMEIFWTPQVKGVGIGDTTPESLFQRFHKETGQPLAQGIGYEYAGAQMLFDAIERAGTVDPDTVLKALGETDLMTMNGRAVFEKGTQFWRWPVAFGQWRKTDKPWVWEAPTVFSFNDFLVPTEKLIFPMPYD
jgi:branched-chain amino acid transport system substrate-binding protein